MKKIISIFFIFSIQSVYAYTLKFDLIGQLHKNTLTAKDSNGSEGKLISKSKFDMGIKIDYSLANAWKLYLTHQKYTYDFDNTDNVISGDRMFDHASTDFGVTWIVASSMAFRLAYTSKDELGFELNGSNQAVFISETLSFASLFWDQILWLGDGYYLGFTLGLDMNASGSTFTSRSATLISAYLNTDSFRFFYNLKTVTKETDDWKFEGQEPSYGLAYVLAF